MLTPVRVGESGGVETTTRGVELEAEEALTDVLRWRFRQLSRAGFPSDSATILACHLEVDLHRAVDLVQRGCPPELALRIVL